MHLVYVFGSLRQAQKHVNGVHLPFRGRLTWASIEHMDCDDATYDSDFDADLAAFLASAAGGGDLPEGDFHVLETLKRSDFEVTEVASFRGRSGSELGPFVRKSIDATTGLGTAYELLFRAQQRGLRCPNLPRIAACSTDGEKTRVLMERLPGRTLEEHVRAVGPSIELAQEAIPQVAAAVECLHGGLGTGAPLIHRDLKPSNVMVVGGQDGIDRTYVVIDLGIARAWRPGADSDTLKLGTRSYAPPEQFGFGQTSVRSDVYALGALLYFCLTGEDPEPGRAAESLARRPDVPAPLARVAAKAMSFDPQNRYASAAELAAAVVLAAAGEGDAKKPGRSAAVRGVATSGAAAPSGTASRGSRRSLVPQWLGRAWNVVLLADWALIACAGVWNVFYPTLLTAAYPSWFRFLEFAVWLPACMGCLTWLFFDKRRLREKHPGLVRWSVWRRAAAVAVLLTASTLFLVIIGMGVGVF